ncbi:MAG TPA: glycosyltransferase family 4 protein [Ardenticatenaceae bacterium]|nr:glycosyltransferase family 4 protein [Ardenticatenaceae bacterium]
MIIQTYFPHIGGAERQLAALAPGLQAQGVEVHVLTRRTAGLARFEIVAGVPVHRIAAPGPRAIAPLAFTLSALPILHKLRPDVLHAHDLLSPTTTALTAKRLFGTPVVVKVLRGGTLGDLARVRSKPLGARRIESFRRHVDAFVAISQEIAAELAAIGIPAERRPLIPNGVDAERFTPLAPDRRAELRAALDLPDVPIVLFSGRLTPEKCADRLVTLWPSVRAAHPDALLLVVGGGPQEPVLRQLAGPGVRFAGRVDDVVPYLWAADLFVLPSATEGLSNSMLEAMAVGLPAIATAVGGAPDVIAHGDNGWLIPPNAPGALEEALLTILGDPGLRVALGRRARQRVASDYSLSTTATRLRALYDQLLLGRTSAHMSNSALESLEQEPA